MFLLEIIWATICAIGFCLLVELFNYLENENKLTNKEGVNIAIRFTGYAIYVIAITILTDKLGQIIECLF